MLYPCDAVSLERLMALAAVTRDQHASDVASDAGDLRVEDTFEIGGCKVLRESRTMPSPSSRRASRCSKR